MRTAFPLYFPYDGHFTPGGHEVAAHALTRLLGERALVPSRNTLAQ